MTDVVAEVREFLAERVTAAEAAGIARERLVVDPGFGFGKTPVAQPPVAARIDAPCRHSGCPCWRGSPANPLWVESPGRAAPERLAASVAAALLAVERGASLVRVHDVAATRDALLVLHAASDPEYRFDDT